MDHRPCCARCVTVKALVALLVAGCLLSYASASVVELASHASTLEGEVVEREAELALERDNLRSYREGGGRQ